MKITYDAEADALSIVFAETTVTTQHLADGIAADFDEAGCLAMAKISWPSISGKRWRPRNPVAPVTSILMQALSASFVAP